jgi:hypothetical protein
MYDRTHLLKKYFRERDRKIDVTRLLRLDDEVLS